MPGIAPVPLPEHLQAFRETIMALPLSERRQLMHRLYSDISRSNDIRHAENHERAERERNRRRPDPRQMSMEAVA